MKTLPYIPKFNGNRDKPKGERIVTHIIPLNYGELTRYNEMSRTWKEKDPDHKDRESILSNEHEIQTEVIKAHVPRIDNHTDFLTGDPIKNGEDLIGAHGDWPIITELINAIYNRSTLEEGLEKNLEPPSDGLSEKNLNGGTVSRVEKKD